MNKTLTTSWFKYLTSNYLIYNTCWEDPSIDRFILDIRSTSDLFMITSAGENAFDYLLDSPSSIDCVDVNPYQNSLLKLKCALFKNRNYEHLQDLLLTGRSENYQGIFDSISDDLDDFSYAFWKARINWFSPQKGFYKQGLTGWFAGFLNFLIDTKKLRPVVEELIHQRSLDIRHQLYKEKIEPILWKGLSKYLWKSELILSFAGIPNTQSHAISDLNEYIKDTIENLFVTRGVQSNYFWRLYLEGKYSADCCPNYLKRQYFDEIQNQIEKIQIKDRSVTTFLNSTIKKYSHFILLDHQDWLIGNGTNELEKEWIAILNSSKPSARILFRSVYRDLNFLPDFVHDRTTPLPIDTQYLLQNDRVGTYPSTFLLEVNV